MGYSNTQPYQQIEIYSLNRAGSMDITNTPTDFNIGNIVIPSVNQAISYAFLDCFVSRLKDASAGNNQLLASGSFGLYDSTPAYNSGYTIQGAELVIDANEKWVGPYVIPGTINLASHVNAGTRLTMFSQIRSTGAMTAYGVYTRLRLYFNVY